MAKKEDDDFEAFMEAGGYDEAAEDGEDLDLLADRAFADAQAEGLPWTREGIHDALTYHLDHLDDEDGEDE